MSASQRLLLAVAGALVGALLQQTWQLLALLVVAAAPGLVPGLAAAPGGAVECLCGAGLADLALAVVYRRAELERGGCAAALHISLRSNIAGLFCIALLAGMNAFEVAAAAARLACRRGWPSCYC
ncbi:hypothetical protein ULG90_13615 [Halopseudomonas pachastrellae]|nr:hypothetical protein ULG90_13615 [Halopseudomonas pachastrellae]